MHYGTTWVADVSTHIKHRLCEEPMLFGVPEHYVCGQFPTMGFALYIHEGETAVLYVCARGCFNDPT